MLEPGSWLAGYLLRIQFGPQQRLAVPGRTNIAKDRTSESDEAATINDKNIYTNYMLNNVI